MGRPLYGKEPSGVDLDAAVYAWEASTIDLCLSLHPWAQVQAFTTSVMCDQIGGLMAFYSSKVYPVVLSRVVVKDETGERITFLTNNFAFA